MASTSCRRIPSPSSMTTSRPASRWRWPGSVWSPSTWSPPSRSDAAGCSGGPVNGFATSRAVVSRRSISSRGADSRTPPRRWGRPIPPGSTSRSSARLRRQRGFASRRDGVQNKGLVDFRRDFLPLILAEMQVRFYRQKALLEENDEAAADEVTTTLARAWSDGRFDAAIEHYVSRYGAFDVESHLLGTTDDSQYSTTVDYEKQVYATIEDDAAEAMSKEASPVKAAYETVRALRDTMRSVIEFQGLELESYLDFQALLSNRFKALVAGPPVRRVLELLALMDAGVVHIPWGPSPLVEPAETRWVPDQFDPIGRAVRTARRPPGARTSGRADDLADPVSVARSPVEPRADPAAALRRRRGWQHRAHQRLASRRARLRRPGTTLGLRVAHRGHPLLHPVCAVPEEPGPRLRRRRGLCRADPRRYFCGGPPPARRMSTARCFRQAESADSRGESPGC